MNKMKYGEENQPSGKSTEQLSPILWSIDKKITRKTQVFPQTASPGQIFGSFPKSTTSPGCFWHQGVYNIKYKS